ncbi:hypothetical protein L6164_015477 [Bauhinia variegata]|uniref:Uncharacterized protein n=1 Tax=Bauhinia variegata TaxID=167791 RepID=A0ACB9NKP8_BAUVA|nr:hypothetical protein L6164_015477 [Bauhinia variegata]
MLRFHASFSLAATDTLSDGSSLSVEEPSDILVSPNGDFNAGFFQVGENAFCFSIWFKRSKDPTVVWMANRDQPVNGKASELSLLTKGNLVLRDAGRKIIWSSTTSSTFHVQLKLMNSGNLVLRTLQGTILWQSFDSPTDTLLPGQPLTERASLVSSRSTTNYSSGFYRLFFDNDNVLRLLFKGPNVSSVFWPVPFRTAIDLKRSTYNVSKIAVLDLYGHFLSSDEFSIFSTDYGQRIYRRLMVDPDGNIRLYSFNEGTKMWEVSWQAISDPCSVHGICGANSMCVYDYTSGRNCYCLQGHKMKDPNDWTQGCEPEFAAIPTNPTDLDFLLLPNSEFYGYDIEIYHVWNITSCLEICLQAGDDCKAVQVKFDDVGTYYCYPKTLLLNGRDEPSFWGDIYLKLPKPIILSSNKPRKYLRMDCSDDLFQQLNATYEKPGTNASLYVLLWFASGIGALELTCVFLVWLCLIRRKSPLGFLSVEHKEGIEQRRLVSWVTEKINSAPTNKFWVEEIADPNMEGQYDIAEVELLVNVALQCVLDDMDSRPTMSQVVEILQFHRHYPFSSSFSATMRFTIIFLLLLFVPWFQASSSYAAPDTLPQGSSLSVEKPSEMLVSANGDFTAGFFKVGDNAFCFSIWFTRSKEVTIVWMANRDQPVNGKASKLSLLKDGNLILSDAGKVTIWSTTATLSTSQLQLKLMDNGNLVLRPLRGTVLWQSFDSPTDTLLPGQPLTELASLVSSRSTTNYSSGLYRLYFDNDNVLRLLFKGPNVSSVYWPFSWLLPVDAGRSTYNISKIAVLDSYGHFMSSDTFSFNSTDYGKGPFRRFMVDPDGNLRLYSFNEGNKMWEVSWQANSQPCSIHGICGANSMCTYSPFSGNTCYCLRGFKMKNSNDWTQGCEPEFTPISCNRTDYGFLHLPSMEFYGYEIGIIKVINLTQCLDICLNMCDDCEGVQFRFNEVGTYNCYPKTMLLNGRDSPNFDGEVYVKVPKATLLSSNKPAKHIQLNCPVYLSQRLDRFYQDPSKNATLDFLLWFSCGVGVLEITCIFLVWFCLFRTSKQPDSGEQRKLLSATGFQRFTYEELKRATGGFNQEIGRGSGGIVYKGILDDNRVAAIKRLNSDANQGEAEFLAEISTIGMLNHMNLIDMWGYCVQGKHRLLVYEYMEHGSLAENLVSNVLDWNKRFNIAVGTAKGLAYLHEECLEWVLHCDVKPQNILLDSDFQPKVADFGLSKLLNRDERISSGFSRIRGTRGYMAPEWIYNLRITAKVDVYSYGIVVLEIITGRSPTEIHSMENRGDVEHRRLVTWVREKIKNAPISKYWIEEIVDPNTECKYDIAQVELLINVALQCADDDMDARPSMSEVVEILQSHQLRK